MMLTENTSFMNIKAKLEGNLIKGHRSTVLHGQEAVEYQKKRDNKNKTVSFQTRQPKLPRKTG